MLKKFSIIAFILTLILAASFYCKEKPSYEPKEVVELAKSSYSTMEVESFLSHMSSSFTEQLERKVSILRESFSGINESARESIAKNMGVNPKTFPNIKLSEYVLYVMNNEKRGMGSDNVILPNEVRQAGSPVDESIEGDEATLLYDNGIKVNLIKENGIWKIDAFHHGADDIAPSEEEMNNDDLNGGLDHESGE